MPASQSSAGIRHHEGAWFRTTQWSVVWRARDGDTTAADEALEKLCRNYWPPVYAFIRREGYRPEDAQDLTQEFLSRLIQKEWLNRLEHQDGRFRNFLLTFLKNFLSDHRDSMRAQKRGGGKQIVSLDSYEAEERDAIEPASSELTADQIYERRWAEKVMQRAYAKLQKEYAAKGKSALFELIKDLQPGEHGEKSYKEIGAALGMTEQAIKNAVSSYRQRCRKLIRAEIAETVLDPAEVNEEYNHLLKIFAR
jgi:RNA polymerase sigma factor (sigma-70 family)